MTFNAFDLWVAMITVGALAALLLGAFEERDQQQDTMQDQDAN